MPETRLIDLLIERYDEVERANYDDRRHELITRRSHALVCDRALSEHRLRWYAAREPGRLSPQTGSKVLRRARRARTLFSTW